MSQPLREGHPIRFATSNVDKLKEAEEILGMPVEGVKLVLDELQTTHLETLTRHKVGEAFSVTGEPVFVEDTALYFSAWKDLPGPFVKYFLENMGLEGMVNALAPFENWEAEAVCGVAYHDGWHTHYFEGRTKGTIVAPQGSEGFGWDPIFMPEGHKHTFADMSLGEKSSISMRAKALNSMATHLHGAPPRKPSRRRL